MGMRNRPRQPLRRRAPTKPLSMMWRRNFAGSALPIVALTIMCANFAMLDAKASGKDRVVLFPKLVAGQVLTYQISYHADKSATTKSTVATSTPQSPSGTETNVRALLRLEVVGVEAQGSRVAVHARTLFQVMNSATHLKVPRNLSTPPDQTQRQDSKGTTIEFNINP